MTDVKFEHSGKTLTASLWLAAPAARVWEVFEDPRKLERWWGPPTWPATFSRYEFAPGGEARYHMTGPDGTQAHGWWSIGEAEFPFFEFTDGFSDADGVPDPNMPKNTTRVSFEETGGGTRLVFRSEYDSEEDLNKVLSMGMEEGFTLAISQIPDVLAA